MVEEMISTVVWGTGNVGRAAIRAVAAHPELELVAVITSTPEKVGRDAGDLAGMDHPLGVAATDDRRAVLMARPAAVVYAASGDLRPDAAAEDIDEVLSRGAVVVTPSLYALYDHRSAPPELRGPMEAATKAGGSALFVSGIDPGWGNDILPLLLTGLGSTIDQVRAQEIFDYSTYDQPDAVRHLVGMGQPMDVVPPMVAPGVPSMVWGGQVRLIARGLGVTLDEVREVVDRRALDRTVTNVMGAFEAGTQGGAPVRGGNANRRRGPPRQRHPVAARRRARPLRRPRGPSPPGPRPLLRPNHPSDERLTPNTDVRRSEVGGLSRRRGGRGGRRSRPR